MANDEGGIWTCRVAAVGEQRSTKKEWGDIPILSKISYPIIMDWFLGILTKCLWPTSPLKTCRKHSSPFFCSKKSPPNLSSTGVESLQKVEPNLVTWLNQPIPKIYDRQMIDHETPGFRGENYPKCLSCHHPEMIFLFFLVWPPQKNNTKKSPEKEQIQVMVTSTWA